MSDKIGIRREGSPDRLAAGRVFLEPRRSESGRREYSAVFMQPGLVRMADQTDSSWLIPAEVIAAAEPLFDARPMYLNHPEMFGFGWRQDPDVEALVGVTFSPEWVGGEMIGGVRLYDAEPGSVGAFVGVLMDQILADKAAGREVPPVGLSAVVYQQTRLDQESGLRVTTVFDYVRSVDVVYQAGAGGYIRAALAAMRPSQWRGATSPLCTDRPCPDRQGQGSGHVPGGGTSPPGGGTLGGGSLMEPDVLVEADSGNNGASLLSSEQLDALMARMEERFDARMAVRSVPVQLEPVPAPVPDSVSEAETPATSDVLMERLDQLSANVNRLTLLWAEQIADDTVDAPTPPRGGGGISLGLNSIERIEKAFEAMMMGVRPPDGIPSLLGLKHFYHLLSGDGESLTGLFQEDNLPVFLANVTSAVMARITANVLNKMVVNEFMQFPQWWAPAVTIRDFTSLQDVSWISLGGIGELPTVAEGASYVELSWDDFRETDAFVKKGGYLGISMEAIDKDDVGQLRAAPRALAEAAWKTLGRSISAIFTTASGTGPTMSDGNVLFDASNHGNLLTTAWSPAQFEVVKIAMMKQTEIHSGDRLGGLNRPLLVWCPVDLEDTIISDLAGWQVSGSANWNANVEAEGNERETRLANARRRVIACPFWTNTANWAAQADPILYPSIGLGFRFGRVPEIFSVADPRAGLMFTNDTMPVKVRYFFAVGPVDWRGLHKSNI